MTLTEYLAIEQPTRTPVGAVKLSPDEYHAHHAVRMPIGPNGQMRCVVTLNHYPHGYILTSDEPTLWTMDEDGNPKKRSVFAAPTEQLKLLKMLNREKNTSGWRNRDEKPTEFTPILVKRPHIKGGKEITYSVGTYYAGSDSVDFPGFAFPFSQIIGWKYVEDVDDTARTTVNISAVHDEAHGSWFNMEFNLRGESPETIANMMLSLIAGSEEWAAVMAAMGEMIAEPPVSSETPTIVLLAPKAVGEQWRKANGDKMPTTAIMLVSCLTDAQSLPEISDVIKLRGWLELPDLSNILITLESRMRKN